MATVYLAVAHGSSGFRKLAVVKLIRPQNASDPELIEMFLDEARLGARLNHPNIVQTYDVGIDGGQHLMAMEYLDGVSFNAAIARLARAGGPLTFPLRARVLLEVLEGLRYAHDLKDYDGTPLHIVHRDVTPHNIFVTYDGQVKLLDFGIAKATTSSAQTATGVIKGKLTYMSPEQTFGDPVDSRADLYAVGVMLWEALTGRRRFPPGLSDAAMFSRVASGEIPDTPRAASLGYPDEIDVIVAKALAPKRDDRFQSAGELHDALDAALRKVPPASLRDLGAMLAESFRQERQRIRHVIEEQFRRIDAAPPSPSAAGLTAALPRVQAPWGGGDSIIHDRPSHGSISAAGATVDELPVTSGTTKGLSTLATRVSEMKPQRVRLAFAGIAGAALVAVFALLGPRLFGTARGGSAVRLAPTPGKSTIASAPGAASEERSDKPAADEVPSEPPALPHASESQRDEARREETRHEEAREPAGEHPRAFPGSLHHEHVRVLDASRETATAESATPQVTTDAGATSSTASTSDVALRHPTAKPKVQLDPDNPWL